MTTRKEVIGTEEIKQKIIQATKVEELVTTKDIYKNIYVCDWCGKESEKSFLDGSITNNENFDFTFYIISGEGTHMVGDGWEIDHLCRECIDKLHDLLIEQGIHLSDVDW